jgi:CBS-domain-containing membrane protein
MEQHQIRRIPVVDTDGRICGIVAQADIATKAGKGKAGEVVKEVSKAA